MEEPREIRAAAEIKSRFTAYKVWLFDLVERQFKQEEGMPDHISIDSKQVARVNIIASVIEKFDSDNYATLVLDDGSAQIRLKAFGDGVSKLKNIETGDIILTIARLRSFNNETYLLPEILKKVSPRHALLRRLELIIEHGKREPLGTTAKRQIQVKLDQVEQTEEQKQEEQKQEGKESLKEKIRILISKSDEGEGVEFSLIEEKFSESKEAIRRIVDEFLEEGEAYEPRPGKIRMI